MKILASWHTGNKITRRHVWKIENYFIDFFIYFFMTYLPCWLAGLALPFSQTTDKEVPTYSKLRDSRRLISEYI